MKIFSWVSLIVILGWMASSRLATAQSQGNNAVYNGSNSVTGSSAFIDASAFCAGGACTATTDFCTVLHNALTLGNPPATGVVVDARGVVPPPPQNNFPATLTCGSNPFANVSTPSVVLLPALNIAISVPWILPDHTKIIGEGRNTDIQTSSSSFTTDASNAMIEMGYYGSINGWSPCPYNNVCTGISIEHLKLDGSNNGTINGIYNANAQDLSYVDDVDLYLIGLAGLVVAGASTGQSGAANSGPYSNLNYAAFKTATCSSNTCPACAEIQTQTRGLHGLSCIGTKGTGNATADTPGRAGIYVAASNNSVEDVHIEGFWDGIQIGGSNSIGNILVSNVTTGYSKAGPVTNAVHICGANSQESQGQCSGSVSDVNIFQVEGDAIGGACTATVLDDQSGTAIGPTSGLLQFVGMYTLGEAVPAGSTTQFSRFVTNPSVLTSDMQSCESVNKMVTYSLTLTPVPAWSVGSNPPSSSTPCVPGAIYSNTAGGRNNSVWVCTTGAIWQPIA